jgi:hypothetical protein
MHHHHEHRHHRRSRYQGCCNQIGKSAVAAIGTPRRVAPEYLDFGVVFQLGDRGASFNVRPSRLYVHRCCLPTATGILLRDCSSPCSVTYALISVLLSSNRERAAPVA